MAGKIMDYIFMKKFQKNSRVGPGQAILGSKSPQKNKKIAIFAKILSIGSPKSIKSRYFMKGEIMKNTLMEKIQKKNS